MQFEFNCFAENQEEFIENNVGLIKKFAKRLYEQNMCAGKAGNISARQGSNCLITTSGSDMAFLTDQDFVWINMFDAKSIPYNKMPSSELEVHKKIYEIRNDVNAIIHCHPCYVNAFGIAGIHIDACIMPEAFLQLDKIETVEYKLPGSKALADAVIEKCTISNVITLLNHGAIALGKDINEAYYRMELLESYAKTLFLAKQLGTINALADKNLQELIDLKSKKGL